jgi:hypothetical protein
LPIEVALTIVLGIAAGLHHAHERTGPDGRPLGIVHRDVSPSNVIVTYDGVVKLVDFGIARAEARSKVTQAGVVKGKRGYMSPEQCRGDAVDRRSDVFGLGILLWELTVGARLFSAENDYAVMSKVVFGLVDDPRTLVPDYPPELAAITMRALQRDPAMRPATARDLALELERFVQRAGLRTSTHLLAEFIASYFAIEPYPTSPAVADPLDGPSTRTRANQKRRSVRRAVIGLAAASLGIVGGGVAWARWGDGAPTREATVSPAAAEPAATSESVPLAEPASKVAGGQEHTESPPPTASPMPAALPMPSMPVEALPAAEEEPAIVVEDDVALEASPTPREPAAKPSGARKPVRPATTTTSVAVPPDATPKSKPTPSSTSASGGAASSKGAPMPSRPNDLFPPTE